MKYFLFSITRNTNNKTFEVFPQYIIVFVIAQLSLKNINISEYFTFHITNI